jgi:outer membrane protein assembly factor BamE (lipoprotein component of BamABCDE complex)
METVICVLVVGSIILIVLLNNRVTDIKILLNKLAGQVNNLQDRNNGIQSSINRNKRDKMPEFEQVFKNPSRRIRKWMLIRIGMNRHAVYKILREPETIDDKYNYWYYDDGMLSFSENSGLVGEYNFQFADTTKDLSQWADVKQQMSKEEVLSILGNPASVDIESLRYDDIDETWYYYDDEYQGVIRFNHLGKIEKISKDIRQKPADANPA